jgi:hypothetical protein
LGVRLLELLARLIRRVPRLSQYLPSVLHHPALAPAGPESIFISTTPSTADRSNKAMWFWYLFQMLVTFAAASAGIYFEQNIAHEHFGYAVPALAAGIAYVITLLLSRLIDLYQRIRAPQQIR